MKIPGPCLLQWKATALILPIVRYCVRACMHACRSFCWKVIVTGNTDECDHHDESFPTYCRQNFRKIPREYFAGTRQPCSSDLIRDWFAHGNWIWFIHEHKRGSEPELFHGYNRIDGDGCWQDGYGDVMAVTTIADRASDSPGCYMIRMYEPRA